MSRLTIDIPDELSQQLDKLSHSKDQSVNDLVCDMLQRFLAIERLHALRAKTVPYAQAQGFHTDEDVFKAIS